MASIYKRGENWRITYHPDDLRVRESLRTKDKDIAQRRRLKIETQLLDPSMRVTSPSNPSCEDFIKR